ncbi:hypothetical protein, partial [Vibrio parahaemolyticus]|uniref:hypothetical protein n=2 Tax=Vibrio TaxID=662 RepID=UPI001120D7D4
MSNSPIEKITDPSFTESAKGLMTLFCIGVIHLVIGVELTDVKIAIPWFPTITFKRPEYLVFLYWGFNFYAIYRYILHNISCFRKYWFSSLYNGLQNPLGEKFIFQTIWHRDSSAPYTVSKSGTNISINGYYIETDPHSPPGQYHQENVCFFTFNFTKNYKFKGITCSAAPHYTADEVLFDKPETKKKWGLTLFVDDEGFEEFKSNYVKSKLYRFKLFSLTVIPYTRLAFTTKAIFDLTL